MAVMKSARRTEIKVPMIEAERRTKYSLQMKNCKLTITCAVQSKNAVSANYRLLSLIKSA